jgi:hypothetical protein
VVPSEKVDERLEIRPDVCVCGEALLGVPGVGKPNVRQVIELPDIKPHVTEYLLQRVRCPCCHALNEPLPPPEAVTCTGPNLTARGGQPAPRRDELAPTGRHALAVDCCH